MVKNKDIFASSVVCSLFIIVSCFFSRIFSNMALKLVDLFVALDFISASGIRAVTLTLFSAFFIVFISFKYGYHIAEFDKKETLFGALAGAGAHFVLSLITLFSPWIASGTKHIGGFIAFGSRYTRNEYMREIPFVTLVIIGIITALIFAGLIVLGVRQGVKERLADREALMGKSEEQAK